MEICVYGASADGLRSEYFQAARELGALMARDGHRLIFGGGAGGLMGACAEGVREGGGAITGVAPRFFDEPGILLQDCTEFIFTETVSRRKEIMAERAEAFIALPGGIGTFEEFIETLTLKQLGRHNKPMVLLNTLGYYGPLLSALENAAEGGFMSRDCLGLFSLCATPAQALERAAATAEGGGGRGLREYTR